MNIPIDPWFRSNLGHQRWSILRFSQTNRYFVALAILLAVFTFGTWVTNADPAFLRILAQSDRYKIRYDAAIRSLEPNT